MVRSGRHHSRERPIAGLPNAYWNAGAAPARYVLVIPPRVKALIEALHAPGADDFAAIFREHASELL